MGSTTNEVITIPLTSLEPECWTAVNRLRLARKLIERRWYKAPACPSPGAVCLIVALALADKPPEWDRAHRALTAVCERRLALLPRSPHAEASPVITYNDHPDTTFLDVISALEEAEEWLLLGRDHVA